MFCFVPLSRWKFLKWKACLYVNYNSFPVSYNEKKVSPNLVLKKSSSIFFKKIETPACDAQACFRDIILLDLLDSSVYKSLVFIRAYSYIRVFEEKYSYFTRILVIYSYFLWFRAHSTRCELFEPVKSYLINLWLQIHGKVLQSWNNQKTCWILNCIGVLWNLNCIRVLKKEWILNFEKQCQFTHFCRKNVASRIYALF